MKRILFICTGNTCRSPMAAGLARRLLNRLNLEGRFEVTSAGLAALPGMPASREAREVLADQGIDLGGHRAAQLSEEQVRKADLIFTMTAGQQRQLLELYPEAWGKVFILKEYGAEGGWAAGDSRLRAVLERISQKRQDFNRAHGEQIRRLEQERAGILKRLQVIEDELEAWWQRLKEELRPEMEELRQLESSRSVYDIPDPVGQSREVYRRCAAELARAIEAALRRLAGEK